MGLTCTRAAMLQMPINRRRWNASHARLHIHRQIMSWLFSIACELPIRVSRRCGCYTVSANHRSTPGKKEEMMATVVLVIQTPQPSLTKMEAGGCEFTLYCLANEK